MEYYLQVLIGGLVLIAVTVPLSDNYKQIKVKNKYPQIKKTIYLNKRKIISVI